MLRIVPFVFVALPVAIDLLVYRRRIAPFGTPRRKRRFLWLTLGCDCLPIAALLVLRLLFADNPSWAVRTAMWICFSYLLAVLPRMAYYLVTAPAFRSRTLRKVGTVVALATGAFLIYGCTVTRRDLRISRITFRSDRLPEAFDGFRIVQIADLHVGSLVCPQRETERLVGAIDRLDADLVLFCGDLINIRYSELEPDLMRSLGSIRSRYGVFSVTGNHDTGVYARDGSERSIGRNLDSLRRRQREMGWIPLENETRYVVYRGDSIALSGIAFDVGQVGSQHRADQSGFDWGATYAGVPPTLFNITLCHLPQLWPSILECGYGDLTLSGHVHGMQMKGRIGTRYFSPAQWLYEQWSGRYDAAGRMLYVNDGIGCVGVPMRLGAAGPEITVIVLKR